MEDFNEEEEFSVSVDPRRSRMAKKREPESQVVSILNHLFVKYPCLHHKSVVDTGRECTDSDTSCSLNFAKVGNFTSRSPPSIKSGGLDIGHLLKSALAGGISCAFSAFLMHPVDTVKVRLINL